VLLACGSTWAQVPSTISWRREFSRARDEAQARNLPLWVQFTGPWCPYCLRMEREAFVHPPVVSSTLDRVVPVSLQSDEHEDLALRFGVSALPATVILRPSGEVIASQEGYLDAVAFQSFLENALAQGKRDQQIGSRAGVARRDHAARLALAAGATESVVALGGYCPVSLVRGGRLTAGRADLAVQYAGLEFRFASPEMREAFLKEPALFLPANGGACLVSQVDRAKSIAGDPRYGVLYRGRLYLCADPAARVRFLRSPETYWKAEVVNQSY
jgi:YHS domain-containing protein/thiol-disulfide isomerase/thioredoxin